MEQKVTNILNKILPFIQGHGGNAWVEKVEGDTATIAVTGACVGCVLAHQTYDTILSEVIRERVPEIKRVIFNYIKSDKKPHYAQSTGISSQ